MARTILKSKRRVYLALAGVTLLALIVVGTAYAITSGSFKYSSTKTGYVSVSNMDMIPDSDNTTYFNSWNGGLSDSGNGCFNAGVNLPQGAKVKSITFTYSSAGTTSANEFFGRFVRMNLDSGNGVDIIDSVNPANDANTPAKVTANVHSNQQNVDNKKFAYGVGVCPGADAVEDDGVFFGAKIKYTYKTAGA
jgi:hypothetical protein